jgi:hypothetical protein
MAAVFGRRLLYKADADVMGERLGNLVVELVPQWIACGADAGNATLPIDGMGWPFLALRPLSPELKQFSVNVGKESHRWERWLSDDLLPPSVPAAIQEAMAIRWLNVLAPSVDWPKVLAHATALSMRTFENSTIVTNLVISPGCGSVDITDSSLSKLTPTLGSSMQSFLRVDGDLRVIALEAIPWSQIDDAADYKLDPEFLHPVNSILELDDVSVHHTGRGDLLIMKQEGIRAARRKGQWRIYEPSTLRDVVADMLASYQVATNVFEFLLDLSFRRHGALLIYDPQRVTLDYVVNGKSIVLPNAGSIDPFRALVGQSVANVSMGATNGLTASKRLMMELASLDGAVIFDESEILAVGAMISTYPGAGNHAGARTTAALSALAYGAYPIKVSADGDIELYFAQDNLWNVEAGRPLSFL